MTRGTIMVRGFKIAASVTIFVVGVIAGWVTS